MIRIRHRLHDENAVPRCMVDLSGLRVVGTREDIVKETEYLASASIEHKRSVMSKWIDFLVKHGYYELIPSPQGDTLQISFKYETLLRTTQDTVQSTIDDLCKDSPETDWTDVAGLEVARLIFQQENMEVTPKDFAELTGVVRGFIKLTLPG